MHNIIFEEKMFLFIFGIFVQTRLLVCDILCNRDNCKSGPSDMLDPALAMWGICILGDTKTQNSPQPWAHFMTKPPGKKPTQPGGRNILVCIYK